MSCSSDLNSELVKFTWEQLSTEIPTGDQVKELSNICNTLDTLDLLTSYTPSEIVGSNGNLSYRYGDEGSFVVTATQLHSKKGLNSSDFAIIDRYEFAENDTTASKAFYHGLKLPSSESILHWYYYSKYPQVNAIIHVHEITDLLYSPKSRKRWRDLGIVETSRYGDAGTIDLPLTVEEVLKNLNNYVILKNHYPDWDKEHTGTVVFAKNLQEAFYHISSIHQKLLDINENE